MKRDNQVLVKKMIAKKNILLHYKIFRQQQLSS